MLVICDDEQCEKIEPQTLFSILRTIIISRKNCFLLKKIVGAEEMH